MTLFSQWIPTFEGEYTLSRVRVYELMKDKFQTYVVSKHAGTFLKRKRGNTHVQSKQKRYKVNVQEFAVLFWSNIYLKFI